MFKHLQIADPRERWVVGVADAALGAAVRAARLVRRAGKPAAGPARILVLRLERIGDLLMAAPAIAAVRSLAPRAHIDLVVGSWNLPLAALLAAADRVETLDAPWLARGGAGATIRDLVRAVRTWRRRRYDLVVNLEGDIRSNLLAGFSGAKRRAGFGMAGGGQLLTHVAPHDPGRHVADNALRLVEEAFDLPAGQLAPMARAGPVLASAPLPDRALTAADALLGGRRGDSFSPRLIGLHPGGDREIKRWAPESFAAAGRWLAERYDASVVLTGSPDDAPITAEVARRLGDSVRVLDLAGRADLPALAAVLARLLVLVTGDTGPMHLASALDVPVVGIFGPSDPVRWGPLSPRARTVRISLPCSPCHRIRRPPARCVGHVPDCLSGVAVDEVCRAAVAAIEARLATTGGSRPPAPDSSPAAGVRMTRATP